MEYVARILQKTGTYPIYKVQSPDFNMRHLNVLNAPPHVRNVSALACKMYCTRGRHFHRLQSDNHAIDFRRNIQVAQTLARHTLANISLNLHLRFLSWYLEYSGSTRAVTRRRCRCKPTLQTRHIHNKWPCRSLGPRRLHSYSLFDRAVSWQFHLGIVGLHSGDLVLEYYWGVLSRGGEASSQSVSFENIALPTNRLLGIRLIMAAQWLVQERY